MFHWFHYFSLLIRKLFLQVCNKIGLALEVWSIEWWVAKHRAWIFRMYLLLIFYLHLIWAFREVFCIWDTNRSLTYTLRQSFVVHPSSKLYTWLILNLTSTWFPKPLLLTTHTCLHILCFYQLVLFFTRTRTFLDCICLGVACITQLIDSGLYQYSLLVRRKLFGLFNI